MLPPCQFALQSSSRRWTGLAAGAPWRTPARKRTVTGTTTNTTGSGQPITRALAPCSASSKPILAEACISSGTRLEVNRWIAQAGNRGLRLGLLRVEVDRFESSLPRAGRIPRQASCATRIRCSARTTSDRLEFDTLRRALPHFWCKPTARVRKRSGTQVRRAERERGAGRSRHAHTSGV